jgi:hypothetical protein
LKGQKVRGRCLLPAEAVYEQRFMICFRNVGGLCVAGLIEGVSRAQTTLFPERLDDWIKEDHLVCVVDLFVARLDPGALGFQPDAAAAGIGRPVYHPAVLPKLFI